MVRCGFLGSGQMAEALARGFVSQGVCKPADIYCTDPMAERKEVFRSFGCCPVDSSIEVRGAGTCWCMAEPGLSANPAPRRRW